MCAKFFLFQKRKIIRKRIKLFKNINNNINRLSTPNGREEMLQGGVVSLDNEDEEVYFDLFFFSSHRLFFCK